MSDDVTRVLLAWRGGDDAALERLMPLVYGEMRKLARHQLARERAGHTLQPTALANEAYLELARRPGVQWQSRAHFLAVTSLVMRRVLVDHARKRRAGKRGGGATTLVLDDELAEVRGAVEPALDVVALDDALADLAKLDARQARVVHLRIFGGLTVDETAEVLGISPATVKLDWSLARAFLRRQLTG